jgi:hypothetical protein
MSLPTRVFSQLSVQTELGGCEMDGWMQGWTTTMMALQMCDQVDLYGFQPYRGRSDQERYHYFDNQVASLKVRNQLHQRLTACHSIRRALGCHH